MPDINLAEMFAQGQGNGFSQRTPLRPMAPNPVAQALPAVGGKPGAGTASVGGIQEAMAKRGSTIMAKYSKHVKTGQEGFVFDPNGKGRSLGPAKAREIQRAEWQRQQRINQLPAVDNEGTPRTGTFVQGQLQGQQPNPNAPYFSDARPPASFSDDSPLPQPGQRNTWIDPNFLKQQGQQPSAPTPQSTPTPPPLGGYQSGSSVPGIGYPTGTGSQEAMAKRSFDFSELMKNKAIRNALIGGVSGLGGGALVDALMPNRASDEKDRWKMPLMGALAGAGAGGFSGVLEQGGLEAPKEGWTEMLGLAGAAQPTGASYNQGSPLLGSMPSKTASQDNEAARVSSAGESSGVKFKHDDEGHLTGASAFDSLDGYMKKAGLNSFQTQFFTNLIEKGMNESMIRATVKTASDKFGGEVAEELNDGLEKLAIKQLWPLAKSVGGYVGKKLGVNKLWGGTKAIANKARQQGTKATVNASKLPNAKQSVKDRAANAVEANLKVPTKNPAVVGGNSGIQRSVQSAKSMATQGHGGKVREMFTPAGFKAGLRETLAQGHNAVKPLYSGGAVKGNLATGGFHAAFNPATGFVQNPGMYMNEDGGIDWSNAAMNTVSNLAAARYAPTRNWMRNATSGQMLGFGAGTTNNLLGGDWDSESLGNAGYFGAGITSMAPGAQKSRELYKVFGGNAPRKILPTLASGKPNPQWKKLPLADKMKQTALNRPVIENLASLEPTNLAFQGAVNVAKKFPKSTSATALGAAGYNYMDPMAEPEYGVRPEVPAAEGGTEYVSVDGEAGEAGEEVGSPQPSPQELADRAQAQATPQATAETQAKVEQHAATAPEGFFETLQQFAVETGGSVLQWVEEMFGESTANFLSENWVSLLAVPAGAGLGQMLGGTGGAVLGALAGPLVAALAQQSGMFGGSADEDTPPSDLHSNAVSANAAAGSGNQYPNGSTADSFAQNAVIEKHFQEVLDQAYDYHAKDQDATAAIQDFVNKSGAQANAADGFTHAEFIRQMVGPDEWASIMEEATGSPAKIPGVSGATTPAPTAPTGPVDVSKPPAYLDTNEDGQMNEAETAAAGEGPLLARAINDPNATARAEYQFKTNEGFEASMRGAAKSYATPEVIAQLKNISIEDATKLKAMAEELVKKYPAPKKT
jgi:hypothetical protein